MSDFTAHCDTADAGSWDPLQLTHVASLWIVGHRSECVSSTAGSADITWVSACNRGVAVTVIRCRPAVSAAGSSVRRVRFLTRYLIAL
jgi:hypothetical protein